MVTHTPHHPDPMEEIRKSAHPLSAAYERRRRWDYISIVVRAAKLGIILDHELKEFTRNPERSLQLADHTVAVLSDFISRQLVTDPNSGKERFR